MRALGWVAVGAIGLFVTIAGITYYYYCEEWKSSRRPERERERSEPPAECFSALLTLIVPSLELELHLEDGRVPEGGKSLRAEEVFALVDQAAYFRCFRFEGARLRENPAPVKTDTPQDAFLEIEIQATPSIAATASRVMLKQRLREIGFRGGRLVHAEPGIGKGEKLNLHRV